MTRLDSNNVPYSEEEPKWYEAFGEEQEPVCHGCNLDHRPVEYYELAPKQSWKYFFYCEDCVIEAWKDGPWKRFDMFLESNNLYKIS